ncbi:hypothetical protein IAE22_33435, partial [Bacillus sp. S34]|nr:hypothetical protein [Bacillus sp. S34]
PCGEDLGTDGEVGCTAEVGEHDELCGRAEQDTDAGEQVLHVVGGNSDLGPSDLDGYYVLQYCDRMDLAYAASDFVVSRAGAGMVCELTAVGLPSVAWLQSTSLAL